jgi:hypothetical protein
MSRRINPVDQVVAFFETAPLEQCQDDLGDCPRHSRAPSAEGEAPHFRFCDLK